MVCVADAFEHDINIFNFIINVGLDLYLNVICPKYTYVIVGYTRKNEQLDQCCQQLVPMLCCPLFNNVVPHPVNNCCQQPLFTVVYVQQPLFNHC